MFFMLLFQVPQLSFRIYLLFVPEMYFSFTSYSVYVIYIALACILYPLHFGLLPLI